MACCVAVSGLDRVRLRLDRVRDAVGEIDSVFLDTPAPSCAPLGRAIGCGVTLKVETLNPVRSFKGRGTETVAALARQKGASRVVCASAGNLGQALAYSGSRRGLGVTVVAASTANPLKLRQIAAFGADVRLEGEDIEDARLLAREIAEADGAYLVEDSLDLATCEGAATIGLELVRDDPGLDVVLVAVGGGAMASGVGYAVGSLAEQVQVIGIQPVGAPAMAFRGLELNPNYAQGHSWYGLFYLGVTGQHDKAIAESEHARRLDPLSLGINLSLGTCLWWAGKHDRAIEQLHKTLEIDPDFSLAHAILGQYLCQQGPV